MCMKQLSGLDFLAFGQGRAEPAPSLTPWHLIQGFCCLCVNLVFKVSHLAHSNSLVVRYSEYKQPADIFRRIKLYLPGDPGEILCTNPERVCANLPWSVRITYKIAVHPHAQRRKTCARCRNSIFDRFFIFESLPRVPLVAFLALPEEYVQQIWALHKF